MPEKPLHFYDHDFNDHDFNCEIAATTSSLEIPDYHEKIADFFEYFRFLALFLVVKSS